MSIRLAAALAASALLALEAQSAAAREPGDPITMAWIEGDVAGLSRILSADGKQTIGFVEYRQRRRGDVLEMERVAHFADGSSDEDVAKARVGKTLEAISGRTIIRDARGRKTVDLAIDVAGGRVTGTTGLGDKQERWDEKMDLPPGTYWGPLIFIVLKSFDRNADGAMLTFHTVAVTPKPRSIDFEVTREPASTLQRPGGTVKVQRYTLKPSVHWLIDPIIQRFAPETHFLVQLGEPPGLARFEGPRNYEGQKIRIE